MLYKHLTTLFYPILPCCHQARGLPIKNFQTSFGRLGQAMALKTVYFSILVLAATALAGCVPEKKYNSLLEAE